MPDRASVGDFFCSKPDKQDHGQVEIFIESTPYTKTVIGFRIPQSGLNQ